MSENLPVPVLVRPLGWGEPSVSEGGFVLPSGTITLLLSDVEGSTRAWEADPKAAQTASAELNELVDELVGRFDGVRPVEQGEGDSFVAAFARARDGVACALAIQRALVGHLLAVRLGVHTGDVTRRDEGRNYVGPTIIRTARLRNLAHGGQTVISEAARDLVLDALPDGASLIDLGVHRLKDLSRPERVFQLCHPDLPDAFPPLRSLDLHPHNLPIQRTTFVGRAGEIAELAGVVAEQSLVTLTGSGGCGKTRLALQVAAEVLDRFADGAWFVDLATVTDGDGIGAATAQALGLTQTPGASPADAVVAHLQLKQALIVVDNCEHVCDEAAVLVDTVLSACPQVRVLGTSRQPLGVDGEVVWRVPSLSVPAESGPTGIEGLSRSEAAQLFVERASRARTGFTLEERNRDAIGEICRRLDGIPLAIELAAARVRVLTPRQIADGLSERFRLLAGAARTALPRQQTLEASIDWSHALLTELERVVFRRLGVFPAGFDLDAASAVCAAGGIEPWQVLDLVTLLVDKNLVTVDDSGDTARYRLLETMRLYAQAPLDAANERDPTATRHRDHYQTLAADAEAHLEGHGGTAWTARLALDYPNLRAALAFSRDHGEWDRLARMAAALSLFWVSHGPISEGTMWLDDALAHLDNDPRLRAETLFGRIRLAVASWDATTIMAHSDGALALAEDLGDDRLRARLLVSQGLLSVILGGPVTSLEEGIDLARRSGGGWALEQGLLTLAAKYLTTEPNKARRFFEECIGVAAQSGNDSMVNQARMHLGGVIYFLGDLREAAALLTDFLEQAAGSVDRLAVGAALAYMCMVSVDADDRDGATTAIQRLETNSRDHGQTLFDSSLLFLRSAIVLADGDNDRALRIAHEAAAMVAVRQNRVPLLVGVVEAELAVGSCDDASTHLDELIESARGADMRFYLAAGLALKGRLARRDGDLALAEAVGHEALSAAQSIEAKSRAIDALEVLAGIAADLDSHEEAARLFGATEAVRHRTGYRRCVSERDADITTVRAALGDERFRSAYEQGRALSLDEAVAYARRGRGERKRPSTGWDSLTPMEAQVVELLRIGRTNAEIGEQLFVSPRTVQAHLSRIYTKLGVNGRTALAALPAKDAR